MDQMFAGFIREQIKTREMTVNLVRGGSGAPVLLLHGYPQTHVCWHLVEPKLAEQFTVVCTDLRGFGDSGKPPSDPEHLAYSKRVLAQDQVEVMRQLGSSKFAVVGHDRDADTGQAADRVFRVAVWHAGDRSGDLRVNRTIAAGGRARGMLAAGAAGNEGRPHGCASK
jgi:pimeloyl-ACP methyl ester carboxylesterase